MIFTIKAFSRRAPGLTYSVNRVHREKRQSVADGNPTPWRSGSALTKKVRTESDGVYLCFIQFSLSSMPVPGQIVSRLGLFAQGAQPLDSSYSAHNVCNVLGNCFFPLPLKSHHLTRLSTSVLLFIFKGLNQDKYSQVKPSRPAALCARLRSALKIC